MTIESTTSSISGSQSSESSVGLESTGAPEGSSSSEGSYSRGPSGDSRKHDKSTEGDVTQSVFGGQGDGQIETDSSGSTEPSGSTESSSST